MSGVATAIVGGTVIGGLITSGAASKAAGAQTDAANAATALSADQYAQTRADQTPWREAGVSALGQMQDGDYQRDFKMSDFQQDPGYAFRMAEGQKAIERSAAARGGLNSGATMKALSRYGQDYASNEYSNAYNRFNSDRDRRFNRLASLAGTGQTANNQIASAGQNYANQAGQNGMAAANASGAASMATANAFNQGIGTGMNTWMQYNMMNKMFPDKGG